MYTDYFGLSEPPFAITPNPRYLYLSTLHRQALEHLLQGIESDGCMVLLTGDVGTGKTTLCRSLLTRLQPETEVALILNPRLTIRELLKTICQELGLTEELSFGSNSTYIDNISNHLYNASARGHNVAIIIDEAQNLAIDVLEQLRLLTDLAPCAQKLLRIVLLGQPELLEILARPELTQINQRITSRYRLTALPANEIRAYIQHRLQVAGVSDRKLFSDKAIRHAIRLTGGIPRLINLLCDRALLGAYAINTDHVDIEIMRRAGEEVFSHHTRKKRLYRSLPIWLAALALLVTIVMLMFVPDWSSLSSFTLPNTGSRQEQAAEAKGTGQEQAATSPLGNQADGARQNGAGSAPPANRPQKARTSGPQPDGERARQTKKTTAPLSPQTAQPPKHPSSPGTATGQTVPAKTTIRITSPRLILEKAGPLPQKVVIEQLDQGG
ncbi:MAG: AAA family ATPase [Desulfopila sp.]